MERPQRKRQLSRKGLIAGGTAQPSPLGQSGKDPSAGGAGGRHRSPGSRREGKGPYPLLGHQQRGRGARQHGSHILQFTRLLQHLGAVSAQPHGLDPPAYVLTVEYRGFLFITPLTLHDGIPFFFFFPLYPRPAAKIVAFSRPKKLFSLGKIHGLSRLFTRSSYLRGTIP